MSKGTGEGDRVFTDEEGEGEELGLATVTGESIEDASVQVVNGQDADAVRVRVRQLRDQMSDGYFEIGRLLHRVSRQGLWTHWRQPNGQPYESFKHYVELEVEFAFRKAKHLMSIWWWFAEEVKDPSLPEKVKEIGWTKAAMLVGIINARNADAWLAKARKLSATQLGDETKKALERSGSTRRPARPTSHSAEPEADDRDRGSTGVMAKPAGKRDADDSAAASDDPVMSDLSSELPRMEAESEPEPEPEPGVDPLTPEEDEETRTKWTVKVNGPQRSNIESALDEASRIAEVPDGKGFLLDFVATAFLAQHAASGRMPEDRRINMRNDILLAVQRALGVDIVVFEAGSQHCIFGEKTLQRIAAEVGAEAE